MLGYVYTNNAKGALSVNGDLGVKVAVPVGTFFGQLFVLPTSLRLQLLNPACSRLFGYLADVVGRKRMYGIELMISQYFLPHK